MLSDYTPPAYPFCLEIPDDEERPPVEAWEWPDDDDWRDW